MLHLYLPVLSLIGSIRPDTSNFIPSHRCETVRWSSITPGATNKIEKDEEKEKAKERERVSK